MARQPKDRRVKVCVNNDCKYGTDYHNKSVKKFIYDDKFCSICRNELVLVCAKCYGKIEDKNPEHRICKRCEAKIAPKAKMAGNVLKVVASTPNKVAGKVKKLKK